jgi:DNA-binding MarR family transcriptional regulator
MSRGLRSEAAEAIHAAAIRILRIVRVEDGKAGVAPAQLSALSVLVFGGASSLGQLAAAEQVKPPTMSRIVDGLVRQGLASRETHAGDRRALTIAATPKGRKLLLAGRDRRVQSLSRRFENLSAAELATIRKAATLLSVI